MSLKSRVDALTQAVEDLRYCSGEQRRRIETLEAELEARPPTRQARVDVFAVKEGEKACLFWDGYRWREALGYTVNY